MDNDLLDMIAAGEDGSDEVRRQAGGNVLGRKQA